MDFFTTIVETAHERIVTAADFIPFVGKGNWLSFSKGEELGDVSSYPDAAILSGVVYRFRLLGALKHMNKVTIDIDLGMSAGMKRIIMDPDELAIRMDES